jgi:hypothetical protein
LSRLFPQVSPPDDAGGAAPAPDAAEPGQARVFLLNPQDAAAGPKAAPDERAHKVGFAMRSVVRPIAFAVIGATIGIIYALAFFGG